MRDHRSPSEAARRAQPRAYIYFGAQPGQMLVRNVEPQALIASLEEAGYLTTIDLPSETLLSRWDSLRREVDRAELSARELQMLQLIASGCTNDDVAHRAYLSVNTVKSYIRSAYKKIGVTTRSESIIWTIRHGLVESLAHPVLRLDPLATDR